MANVLTFGNIPKNQKEKMSSRSKRNVIVNIMMSRLIATAKLSGRPISAKLLDKLVRPAQVRPGRVSTRPGEPFGSGPDQMVRSGPIRAQ
jgi:hypothetical protein